MGRVDYEGRAGAYRRARTLPPDVLAAWDAAIEGAALPRPRRVLDVGAGPGGFLPALARWSGAAVVAVEPSAAMRDEAIAAGLVSPPREQGVAGTAGSGFAYVGAVAEALPVGGATVGWAWLSTVVHQFHDLDAAAREVHRVLQPGGRALVRGFFADLEITGLFRAFPGIDRAATTFPSTAQVVDAFARAGCTLAATIDVVEPWRFDRDTWLTRVRTIRHTDSALRPLTDEEFEAGVRAVERDTAPGQPLVSDLTLRLLVLAR